MNKQRKVLITTTYNEMGIIIDTKAEEVAQPERTETHGACLDAISRQAAIDAIERLILPQAKGETAAEEVNRVAWRCAINCAEEMIGHLPSVEAERKTGNWIEKSNTYSGECPIDQWQSCKCSECGRYDTRPYLYYFVEPKFCSWCGAEMSEEKEAEK